MDTIANGTSVKALRRPPAPFEDFVIEEATRSKARLKLALTGCSGSGKTYSALMLAQGIVGGRGMLDKVCVLDSENKSSSLYADLGSFRVIDFKPPYSPRRYLEALRFVEAQGFEVLVIDSLSHEWEGEGGCLELHDKAGGRFQDWAKVTPDHRKFFDEIRRSNLHIIGTLRKKTDYALDQSSGKPRPVKVGLKDVQRDGTDYEFDVILEVDHAHFAQATKDRTQLFSGLAPFRVTDETGRALLEWAESGTAVYAGLPEQLDELRRLVRSHGVEDSKLFNSIRRACLGRPMSKIADVIAEALSKETEAILP